MMKRIMTPRVAAAAVAASVLIAAPAAADTLRGGARVDTQIGHGTSLSIQVAHRDGYRYGSSTRRGYGLNEYGQTRAEERQLRRSAVRACRAEIGRVAWRIGFRDVDFDDDRRVRQIGPYGFRIRFDDVEFEGRRREIERDVTCVVRRGNVARLDGIPDGHRYRAGRGYDDNYQREYSRRYRH